MNSIIRRLFESTWVSARLEVLLGTIFVAASFHKIFDPAEFAKMIFYYKVTPNPFINLIAIYMPWIELTAGLALILGLAGRRGGAALVGGLLLVFMAAIAFNLARGNIVDCGCFAGSSQKTRSDLLLEMWWVLFRDLLMLIAVAQIFIACRAEERKAVPKPAA